MIFPLSTLYYIPAKHTWPDPPAGLTLYTDSSLEWAVRLGPQVYADLVVPLVCVVVLRLVLRWQQRRHGHGSGSGAVPHGITRRQYYPALIVSVTLGIIAGCLVGILALSPASPLHRVDGKGPGILGILAMLTYLAARRLCSLGLRPALALPTLLVPAYLLLHDLAPSLVGDWLLGLPEISPRPFSLLLFVMLEALAFFLGLGLVSRVRKPSHEP